MLLRARACPAWTGTRGAPFKLRMHLTGGVLRKGRKDRGTLVGFGEKEKKKRKVSHASTYYIGVQGLFEHRRRFGFGKSYQYFPVTRCCILHRRAGLSNTQRTSIWCHVLLGMMSIIA
jgi:hypothetical protein